MIYFVEDETNIRELVIYTLRSTGFEARGLESGEELFAHMEKEMPEMVLLDIMLPGESGLEILKKLRAGRRTKDVPVIMVTAMGAEYDKVKGLDGGADDYITKPFGVMELVARVRAVLRRRGSNSGAEGAFLTAGDIALDADRYVVSVSGEEVSLTHKEFELLRCLMANKGRVLSRDSLLETVWGYDFGGETRTVDVHIRTLRQKLGEGSGEIETVRGVGYRIGGA